MGTARYSRERQSPSQPDQHDSKALESPPLGRLLTSAGAVTQEAVHQALAVQRKTFRPLGRILREEHGLTAEALADGLRKQSQPPRIFLRFFPIEREALQRIDPRLCTEQELLAFERLGDLLCVAFANPHRHDLILQLRTETRLEIAPFAAPWEDIQKALQ